MSSSRPPRDLNALLSEIKSPSDVDRCRWASAFRQHLSKNVADANSAEALFDFCVAANALRLRGESVRDASGKVTASKADMAEADRDRMELLRAIHKSFFCEDAPRPISLSNAVLRNDLWKALEELDDVDDEEISGTKVEEAYELIWQARCDYKVWKGGLHKMYSDFVASKPSPGLTAVIMSLL